MSETKRIAVAELSLDLGNYRTVKQADESAAVEAMVSTSPDRFLALTESLLNDGFLPTESIIVLKDIPAPSVLTVKEGNRRVAVLKLLHGIIPTGTLAIPPTLAKQIAGAYPTWLKENATVPCTVFEAADASIVDRIVTLAHGKGEKAGRDQWNAVARARHNRDANSLSEPALDLLERYLQYGKNITTLQKGRWAGDYPLSVLAEAMKRLARRVGVGSSAELANAYPKVQNRDAIEDILHDIGQGQLGFDKIRDKNVDFGLTYGLPLASTGKGGSGATGGAAAAGGKTGPGAKTSAGGTTNKEGKGAPSRKLKAIAINDPKSVRRLLRDFVPRGKRREKVVALRDEAVLLDLLKTPMAFCFVLRSMFEISAKAYCADHGSSNGPSMKKSNGKDKPLADALRDITNHLTKNNSDQEMVKALHGAMADLGKANGLLSVTSMNQLIHNPHFSIAASDIALLFGNVFPLLQAMND